MKTLTTMAIERGITPARIRANIAARKRAVLKPDQRTTVRCADGPWEGFMLSVPSWRASHWADNWQSAVFTVNGQTGRYVAAGYELRWEPVKRPPLGEQQSA